MTDYQKAVEKHMATAPEELRDYVCGRLTDSSRWAERLSPIGHCGFSWGISEEGYAFWYAVSFKQWQEAMETDFWKYHITITHPKQNPLTPISEMEIGQVFAFGTGRWKIVSVENGQAQCERLPDLITLPITQQVPAE